MAAKLIPTIAIAIAAMWIVAIAILSVQNATPVSLQFLGFRSIQLPVGMVLAASAAVGMLAGAIAILLSGDGSNGS